MVATGLRFSTYGPTPTHLRSFELAEKGLTEARRELNDMVERLVPDMEKRLEAAGVPWTPGRAVPGTK